MDSILVWTKQNVQINVLMVHLEKAINVIHVLLVIIYSNMMLTTVKNVLSIIKRLLLDKLNSLQFVQNVCRHFLGKKHNVIINAFKIVKIAVQMLKVATNAKRILKLSKQMVKIAVQTSALKIHHLKIIDVNIAQMKSVFNANRTFKNANSAKMIII